MKKQLKLKTEPMDYCAMRTKIAQLEYRIATIEDRMNMLIKYIQCH